MASKNVTDDVAPPVPSVENGFYSFFSVLQPGFAVVSSISIDEIEEEQPGKVYIFDEQYEVSKEAEEWFIRFALRWKAKGIIRDFIDVRKNIHYQDVDVDFICILPDGTRRTYEVKGDFTKTGNLFAEYAVPTYVVDDNDRRKSSLGMQNWDGCTGPRPITFSIITRHFRKSTCSICPILLRG